MSRLRTISAIAFLALVLLIALIPLGAVLPGPDASDAGLTARRAQGVIWDGWLREAHVGGVALGDMHVRLDPLSLLAGEVRFRVATSALNGSLLASVVGRGVKGVTGTVQTMGRLAPLPISSVAFEGFGAVFNGNRCVRAEGTVRATVMGDLGGMTIPGGLAGSARCDGAALLLPLTAPSGLERLDLRIAADGHWRAEASVKPGDPALAAKLMSSGFAQGPSGLVLRFAGHL